MDRKRLAGANRGTCERGWWGENGGRGRRNGESLLREYDCFVVVLVVFVPGFVACPCFVGGPRAFWRRLSKVVQRPDTQPEPLPAPSGPPVHCPCVCLGAPMQCPVATQPTLGVPWLVSWPGAPLSGPVLLAVGAGGTMCIYFCQMCGLLWLQYSGHCPLLQATRHAKINLKRSWTEKITCLVSLVCTVPWDGAGLGCVLLPIKFLFLPPPRPPQQPMTLSANGQSGALLMALINCAAELISNVNILIVTT